MVWKSEDKPTDFKKMYAHYYAGRGKKTLIITSYPSITIGNTVREMDVTGKKEARKIAAEYGAKCWNF